MTMSSRYFHGSLRCRRPPKPPQTSPLPPPLASPPANHPDPPPQPTTQRMGQTEIPHQTGNHRTLPTVLNEMLATLQTGSGAPHPSFPRDNESDDDDWHRSGEKQNFQLLPQGFVYLRLNTKHRPNAKALSRVRGFISFPCLQRAAWTVHPGPAHTRRKRYRSVPPGFQTLEKTHKRPPVSVTIGSPHHRAHYSHGDVQTRIPSSRAGKQTAPLNSPASAFRHPLRGGNSKHGQVQGKNLSLALHTPAPRVSAPNHSHVRDHIDHEMTHKIFLEKKRIAAVRAIEEVRANRPSN